MKKLLLPLIAFLFLFVPPDGAHAATAAECRVQIQEEFAGEQRRYRTMLYGKRTSKDELLGAVRYDFTGAAWLKDAPDRWISSATYYAGVEQTDESMDIVDEHADLIPTIGIFETKRVLTSELIPYLLQSLRAFECRLDLTSERVRMSERQNVKDPVALEPIQPPGCMEFREQFSIPQCHLSRGMDPSLAIDLSERDPEELFAQSDIRGYPEEIANALLAREIELLKLAVEYDAGYRSLLQFAGNFNIFIKEMRWIVTGTLRSAAQLMGNLQRLPCIMNACDGAPAGGSQSTGSQGSQNSQGTNGASSSQ